MWSTDWFDNPSLQTTRLLEKLEPLRRKPAVDRSEYTIVNGGVAGYWRASGYRHAGPRRAACSGSWRCGTACAADRRIWRCRKMRLLTELECFEALRKFREQVIANEMAD